MAKQIIDTTTDHGTYKGDPAVTAFNKTNDNFNELYTLMGGAVVGNYSQRPAAGDSHGRLYFSLDTQELFTPVGDVWLLLPCGGVELGYAQRTTPSQYTTNVYADITGVSFTYVAGERSGEAKVRFTGKVSSGTAVVALFLDDVIYQQILVSNTGYQTIYSSHRLPPKEPGTSVNVKLRAMHSDPGQTFDIFGADVDPVALTVVNR